MHWTKYQAYRAKEDQSVRPYRRRLKDSAVNRVDLREHCSAGKLESVWRRALRWSGR